MTRSSAIAVGLLALLGFGACGSEAPREPNVVRFRAEFTRTRPCRAHVAPAPVILDPGEVERLRALGYLDDDTPPAPR